MESLPRVRWSIRSAQAALYTSAPVAACGARNGRARAWPRRVTMELPPPPQGTSDWIGRALHAAGSFGCRVGPKSGSRSAGRERNENCDIFSCR